MCEFGEAGKKTIVLDPLYFLLVPAASKPGVKQNSDVWSDGVTIFVILGDLSEGCFIENQISLR